MLAIKSSTYEILMLLIFYVAAILFFGFFIYYAESYLTPKRIASGSPIVNIPLGMWYSLATVTTVGFGDMYPVTWGGYLIGFLCQLIGVVLSALTIPIVANNFTTFYLYAKTRHTKKFDDEPSTISQPKSSEPIEIVERTVDIT